MSISRDDDKYQHTLLDTWRAVQNWGRGWLHRASATATTAKDVGAAAKDVGATSKDAEVAVGGQAGAAVQKLSGQQGSTTVGSVVEAITAPKPSMKSVTEAAKEAVTQSPAKSGSHPTPTPATAERLDPNKLHPWGSGECGDTKVSQTCQESQTGSAQRTTTTAGGAKASPSPSHLQMQPPTATNSSGKIQSSGTTSEQQKPDQLPGGTSTSKPANSSSTSSSGS